MLKGKFLKSMGLGSAGLLLILVSAASADVTVKRHTVMKGMGGLMNSTVTSSESYKGDMLATEDETKMDSKLMKMFGAGKPIRTTSIVRLDKQLMWNVNHKEKTYTEMTFAQVKQMMDSLGQVMSSMPAIPAADQQQADYDTSEIVLSPPKFSVTRPGKHETILGQDCEQAVLTMTIEGTNRKTQEKVAFETIMDMMLAENLPGSDEVTAFGMRAMREMGFEMKAGAAEGMTRMMSMYGIDAEKLAEEAKKIEGVALRTTMTMMIKGDQLEAARAQAEADQKKAEEEKTEQDKKDGESTPTDAAGAAAKVFGGLFGKKDKDKNEEEKKEKSQSELPPGTLIWLETTVMGIETSPVPAGRFEIPDGYKLEKAESSDNE